MWVWTAALALCAVLVTELSGWARIVIFIVIAVITGYGIIKLRLLQPVLLHHYNPRGKRSRNTEAQPSKLPSDQHSDQPSDQEH